MSHTRRRRSKKRSLRCDIYRSIISHRYQLPLSQTGLRPAEAKPLQRSLAPPGRSASGDCFPSTPALLRVPGVRWFVCLGVSSCWPARRFSRPMPDMSAPPHIVTRYSAAV